MSEQRLLLTAKDMIAIEVACANAECHHTINLPINPKNQLPDLSQALRLLSVCPWCQAQSQTSQNTLIEPIRQLLTILGFLVNHPEFRVSFVIKQ